MKTFAHIFFSMLVVVIFSCNSASTGDPQTKHADLQKLEIDIIKKINEGDNNAALDLLKDLVHPSSESYECAENIRKKFDCYSYDEWWTERREYLQEQILGGNGTLDGISNNSAASNSEMGSLGGENTDSLVNSDISESEKTNLPDNYIGLYVFQFSNGNTKFFKFFKDSKGEMGVVYQDNVSGNVRVENYMIQAFNETTKDVTLESKKNPGALVNLRFATDQDSDNGLKIVDAEGTIFSLVGK